MPNCKSKCKCSEGGCEVENEEFLQAMEQEPKATGAMETNAAAVWGDEDIPECVHYSFAGDDQVSSNKLYCNGVGLCLCTIVIFICSCLTPLHAAAAVGRHILHFSVPADLVLFARALPETRAAINEVW